MTARYEAEASTVSPSKAKSVSFDQQRFERGAAQTREDEQNDVVLAKAIEARKLKAVGSADEMYGAESLAKNAGEGTLGESNVMVGVRGMRK